MERLKAYLQEIEIELTQASRFILPMLYVKNIGYDFFITENFRNCFISDANHSELGDKIYLLYNYKLTLEYIQFERKIEKVLEYNTDYDYSDERQVMYVFNIPEEHISDFMLFKSGFYTKFSEKLKCKILSFWKIDSRVRNNSIRDILYGVESMEFIANSNSDVSKLIAEGEVWAKPILIDETYMTP